MLNGSGCWPSLNPEDYASKTQSYNFILYLIGDIVGLGLYSEKFCNLQYKYHKANGVYSVYSVEDCYTFENIPIWVEDIFSIIGDNQSIVQALIGNKCGLPNEVPHDQIKEHCKDKSALLYVS